MSSSVPVFKIDENQFVPYEEVTGEQLRRAVTLARQDDVPANYYVGVKKMATAFRRAGGRDGDKLLDVLGPLTNRSLGARGRATVKQHSLRQDPGTFPHQRRDSRLDPDREEASHLLVGSFLGNRSDHEVKVTSAHALDLSKANLRLMHPPTRTN
jgi:hypothetical protein